MQLKMMHLVYLGKIQNFMLSSIKFDRGNTSENSEGAINWDHDCSLVWNLPQVPTNAAIPNKLLDLATTGKKYIDFTVKERGISSTTSKTKAARSAFIREAISNREILQKIEELVTDSWLTFIRCVCAQTMEMLCTIVKW